MPVVGFGTWQLRGRHGYDAIRYALEAGYRHIDDVPQRRTGFSLTPEEVARIDRL